jgi:hypothetical protein
MYIFSSSGLRLSITSDSLQRPRLNHRLVHMQFMVARVVLDRFFLEYFDLFHVSNIPPMLHFHTSFFYYWCYITFTIDSIVLYFTLLLCVPSPHTSRHGPSFVNLFYNLCVEFLWYCNTKSKRNVFGFWKDELKVSMLAGMHQFQWGLSTCAVTY